MREGLITGTLMDQSSAEHLADSHTLLTLLQVDPRIGMTSARAKQALLMYGKNYIKRSEWQRRRWSRKEWDVIFNFRINQPVQCVRDGRKRRVRGAKLVRGDIVHLSRHEAVPADMRVLSADTGLQVDGRIITGCRSERKSEVATSRDPLKTENVLYAGTSVLEGSCIGVILHTARNTVYSRLAMCATKMKFERRRSIRRKSSGNQRTSECSEFSTTSEISESVSNQFSSTDCSSSFTEDELSKSTHADNADDESYNKLKIPNFASTYSLLTCMPNDYSKTEDSKTTRGNNEKSTKPLLRKISSISTSTAASNFSSSRTSSFPSSSSLQSSISRPVSLMSSVSHPVSTASSTSDLTGNLSDSLTSSDSLASLVYDYCRSWRQTQV